MEKQNFNEKPPKINIVKKSEKINMLKEQENFLLKTIKEFQKKLDSIKISPDGAGDKEIGEAIETYRSQLKSIRERIDDLDPQYATNEVLDSIFKNSEEKSIEQIVEILKKEKISQIIVHSQENVEQGEKRGLSLKRDLDTQTALYILNNLVNKSDEELYSENAVTSFIPKGGTINDIEEAAQRKGVRVFIDAGGSWLRVEGTNGTKTIYLDHHGTGQHKPTSATEMIYKILKEADFLKKPEPEWLKKYVEFVNECDNLTYLENKDEKGNKIYNKEYFEKKWTRTPYALADFAPIEFLKAYEAGTIKDLSIPLLTVDQMMEIGGKKLFQKFQETSIEAKKTTNGIENADRNDKKEGLNLKNTRLGNIVYHNFPKIKPVKGNEFVNQIKNNLAFVGTKMLGGDTYICWNKQNGTFFISSKHPNLEEVIEKLEKADPGCAAKDVRGNIIFGKIQNLTEEQFLNIIDPNILKNKKKENTGKTLSEIEK